METQPLPQPRALPTRPRTRPSVGASPRRSASRKRRGTVRRARLLWLMLTSTVLVVLVAVSAAGMFSGRIAVPDGWSWSFWQAVNPVHQDAESPSTSTSTAWTAEVATDVLNVRDSASLQAEIIAALTQGDRVMVAGGNVDGFVPVSTANGVIRGWVAVAYLQPIDGTGWAFDPDHGASIGDAAASASAGAATETASDPDSAAVNDDPPTAESDRQAVVAGPTSEPTATIAPTATATAVPTGEHWIDVNRSTATVTLYIGTTVVAQYSARIGRDPSADGFYSTAVGTFHVYSMQKDLSSTPFVDDVYLSDWVGFDPDRKNGFHSPVRNADGSVREPQNLTTMGCVRLGETDAQAVFAFAEIGMRVEIHD